MFPRRASAATLAACLLTASCLPVSAGEPTSGTVVKACHGDTITIESHGARHWRRLLGIDAPEISYGRLRSEMEKVVKYASAEVRPERGAPDIARPLRSVVSCAAVQPARISG